MNRVLNSTSVTLNDLPKYTNWVPYLLNLRDVGRELSKTPENIQREYGIDKWGNLLATLKKNPHFKLQQTNEFIYGVNRPIAYSLQESLFIAELYSVQQEYFNLIQSTILPHVDSSASILELGAGYGTMVLQLASNPHLKNVRFFATEYTETGVECIRLLAERENLSIKASLGDINQLDLTDVDIPSNTVIFTSWVMGYLKGFPKLALEELIAHKPKIVIHIEPIFEHWCNHNSLLHLLWQRYSQLNDYNQTMLTDLKTYEARGLIQIVDEAANVCGLNPLAPVSIIKWKAAA